MIGTVKRHLYKNETNYQYEIDNSAAVCVRRSGEVDIGCFEELRRVCDCLRQPNRLALLSIASIPSARIARLAAQFMSSVANSTPGPAA